MTHDESTRQTIREAAAEKTRKRMKEDQKLLSGKLRRFLVIMERDLFDPELDITTLKERAEIRDNSVPIQFHHLVGSPPHAYLEDRRMEAACCLLADSPLRVWEIAATIGYSSLQVFSRAFLRWSGERPTEFRRRQCDTALASGGANEQKAALGEEAVNLIELRHALRGTLPQRRAKRLLQLLYERYPALRSTPEPVETEESTPPDAESDVDEPSTDTGTEGSTPSLVGDLEPEEIWKRLQALPPGRQRQWIREHSAELRPRLVEHLLHESEREETADPSKAVVIADLALCAVESLPGLPEDQGRKLIGAVWVRMGNALQASTSPKVPTPRIA